MIRRLRQRHRLLWAVLAPILLGLLATAYLLRPEPPVQNMTPALTEEAELLENPGTSRSPR